MKTITASMTVAAINKVLAGGGDILFKRGTYKLKATLILCSDSSITCEEGVIFEKASVNKLMRTKVSSGTTKYAGVKNVVWNGGTFKGSTTKWPSNLVELIHSQNITFINTTFKDGFGRHLLEIHASKKITITGCVFDNLAPEDGKTYKEAIQIDFSNYDGLQYADANAKTYDGTHCQDIYIHDCKFTRCNDCIGSHTVSDLSKSHKGIIITENVASARDAGASFAKLPNMKNVVIEDNKVVGYENVVYIHKYATAHMIHGGTNKNATNGTSNVSLARNVSDYDAKDIFID